MKKNIPIVQENSFGCGIACATFALGLNYQKTLRLFKKDGQRAISQGFYCRHLVKILNSQGNNFDYKYIKSKIKNKIYQNNSIVFIKRSKKYPFGHYLCRYKRLWMDPWINFQKNKNIKEAKAGFRKKLPDKPIYVIFGKTK